MAKSVFVAKDAATAKAYATDPDGPYVYYYRSAIHQAEDAAAGIELFKTRRDQPDDEVTLESICDKLIIHGTPESVADQLLAFQEDVGSFGTLLYAGKDWKDRELGRRSMILMAEQGHAARQCRDLAIRADSRRVVRTWPLAPIASPIRRRSTGRS